MDKLTIRTATENDLEAIVRLWREMMDFHQGIDPRHWTVVENADEVSIEHYRGMLTDPDRRVFVADSAGELVGFLVARKEDRPPVFPPPPWGAIGTTCVTASARRRGAGRALVAAALAWFKEQGFPVAKVSFATGNPASSAFWPSLGFRPHITQAIMPLEPPPAYTPPTDQKAYFAATATSYDRLMPAIAGPVYSAGLDMVVDLVPHDTRDAFEFIELGCGTAAITKRLLDRFPNARATAVDSEAAMLDIARAKLAPCSDRAQIIESDALSCDLGVCDVVISSFMFHHIPDESLGTVLNKIARALRPGGCLILLDQMSVGPLWGDKHRETNRRLYRRHVERAIAAGLTSREEVDARFAYKRHMKEKGEDVEYPHTAEQILEAMQLSGFDEAGIVWRMAIGAIITGFTPERK